LTDGYNISAQERHLWRFSFMVGHNGRVHALPVASVPVCQSIMTLPPFDSGGLSKGNTAMNTQSTIDMELSEIEAMLSACIALAEALDDAALLRQRNSLITFPLDK